MSNLYGTALHQALRQTVADLGVSLPPSALERALVDLESDSPAEVVHEALGECGLVVADIDNQSLGRALGPNSAIIGIGEDQHVVLSHRSRRRVSETVISRADGLATHHRRRRRGIEGIYEGTGFRWVVVSREQDLSPMASPGGYMEPWKRLWAMVHVESRDVSVVALYAATLGALTLVTPIATQALVNTIAFGAIMQPLIVLTIALFIGLALAGSLAALQAYVVEVLQRRILVRVAEDFAGRLPRLADQARDRKNLVELSNRFLDVITVQKSAAELLLTGLALMLQTVVGMVLLAFYHPVLLGFDIVLVALVALVFFLGRGGTETAIAESKAKFAIAAWLDELARAPHAFVGGDGRLIAAEEIANRSMGYVKARRTHYRKVFSVLVGGVALQVLAIVGLLGVGGWLVIERQLTLGQLIAAEIVVSAIAFGIAKFGRLADKTFDLVAATDKLGKILDLPLRRDGSDPLYQREGGMTVRSKGLRTGYAGEPIHEPVDIELGPGNKALLDGRSGSGRSALLETLAGIRQPLDGVIRWDGHSRPKIDDAREHIALVRDEVVAGTVFNNLRMGNAALSTVAAWQALESVGLGEVIDALPGGLDCELLPSGAPLSPGQVRRLALAKTLVACPSLVLIDESLDFLSEDEDEQRRLSGLFLAADSPCTTIVASRDPRVRALLENSISITESPR